MTFRHALTILIIVFILFLPYWVYIPMLFLAAVVLPFYWEGVVFALLIEILYGSRGEMLSLMTTPLVLIVLLFVIISIPIRDNLRTYA